MIKTKSNKLVNRAAQCERQSFFDYFRLRAPTFGSALGKSNLYLVVDGMQFLQEQKTAKENELLRNDFKKNN